METHRLAGRDLERQRAGAVRGRFAVPPVDECSGHEIALTIHAQLPSDPGGYLGNSFKPGYGNHQRFGVPFHQVQCHSSGGLPQL
ncbi:hypothetical protein D3C75_1292470 [compost metagenome]